MRLFPIHPHTHLRHQRYFQHPFIHFRHNLRQFFFNQIQFGFGYFQHQFVMHLHNQFAFQAT